MVIIRMVIKIFRYNVQGESSYKKMKCLPISIGMEDRSSSAVQAQYPCNASVLFDLAL